MLSVEFHGHACFSFETGGVRLLLDPWKQVCPSNISPVDIFMYGHEHFDHYSPEIIDSLIKESTQILTGPAVSIPEELRKKNRMLRPGEGLKLKGIDIHAVAAYNLTRFRTSGVPYHPKGNGIGFILNFG